MRALITLSLLLIAAPLSAPLTALAAEPELFELPVRRVFFPMQGYDDNDNVQIIIEGELPDPCYVIGKQTFARDAASGVITVHQFAWRRAGCDNNYRYEESPFSEELSLGLLEAGAYGVAYSPKAGGTAYRPMSIARASIGVLDELAYARVTTLMAPDLVLEPKPVKVSLSGTLNDPCNEIKLPIAVARQGDTIVLRPVEVTGTRCHPSKRTFEVSVDLGVLAPGEYLVHVRSRNGKAVEKTLEVR